MTRTKWCSGAIVIAALVLASAAVAQMPPQNLHKVDDHWTAWNPPSELPEGAEVHIIEPGDTLWDLSARFYGDPYLWPQLWERNQYIEDAHWIYPGDPLVISVEVTPIEELGDVDLGEEEDDRLRLTSQRRAPHQLGSEDDIYCSGYIGPDDEQFGYRIIGSEYEVLSPTLAGTGDTTPTSALYGTLGAVKNEYTIGDIVYLDGGAGAGLAPGQIYVSVRPSVTVRDPHTGDEAGRLYEYEGRVRVLSVQAETAIGEIVQSCQAIHIGSGLKPFVPEPVPLGRKEGLRPPNVPSPAETLDDAPVILYAKDGLLSLGEDHVVYVNVGFDQGAAPGDLYTIYRMNGAARPPVVVGELALLSVHDSSAVAKIIETRYSVYIGDRLELK